MNSIVAELLAKIERLSPSQQTEVLSFVDALLSQTKPLARVPMTFEWAGALADLREQYTSVELQKQANLWREEMALGYLRQDDQEEENSRPVIDES